MLQYGFDTPEVRCRSVVTIGSFDGVHQGHRALLEHLKAMARRMDAESVVVTFDPHPRIAMGRAEGMQLLTTIEERARLLDEVGIDRMVVAHFDDKFREQSFEEFVRGSLVAKLGMRGMVVGYNHRLGRGSEGSYDSLVPLGEKLGFRVERVEQFTASGCKISSTVVRNLFDEGNVERACEILGHRYVVMGEAIEGELNIKDEYKLIPADGEYSVNILGHGERVVSIVNGKILVDKHLSGKIILEF